MLGIEPDRPNAALMADIMKTTGRKILPARKKTIRKNILKNLKEMQNRKDGFSMDPRSGRFLDVGADRGYMMATSPERPGVNRVNPTEENILEYLSDPEIMRSLQTGRYLGGWLDPSANEFVLDTPARFINENRANIIGARAGQKAGFDVKAIDEYQLTPEAIEQALQIEALRRLIQQQAVLGGTGLFAGLAGDDNE
jgi:hypothetical protein